MASSIVLFVRLARVAVLETRELTGCSCLIAVWW
jgi:hypothetical protein